MRTLSERGRLLGEWARGQTSPKSGYLAPKIFPGYMYSTTTVYYYCTQTELE